MPRADSRDGPAAAGSPPDTDPRVVREQLASVYFTYGATFAARMVFILVFGGFIYLQLHNMWALVFVAGHVVLYLGLYRTPRWSPAEPASRNGVWVRRITRVVTVLGCADAFAPWLFVPAGNVPVTAVLMVVMLGNCARAGQSLRPLRGALLGNTLPPMLSLIAALLWTGGSLDVFLAAFATIYYLLMLRVAAQENRVLTQALTLRFENEALARRLAEQVEQTQRASDEKTRFLATASHDLRQPLHAIALFGAALESEVRGRPESAHAERLMHAVNALGHSLDTMLDVSRLDAGVVTPGLRPVSLDALFVPLNHTFAPQAEHRELQLRMRASGLWVRSDPRLLHRLLSNLVDNALKYTRQGGVVVASRLRGDQVWIEVRDTGIGIPAAQLERVFEEFYQLDNPGRDRARGMGIGLAIVRRLSRLLDHPMEVRSRLGRGTCFRIRLPAVAALPSAGAQAVVPSAAAAAAAPLQRGMRLLLVDDEAQIRDAMTGLLASHGIELTAVANEAAAASELRRAAAGGWPFALFLSDLRLADGADGLQVSLRLRAQFDPSLPVLLVTGETAPERLLRVREAGLPVLYKPVGAARLLEAIAQHARVPAARA